MFVSKCEGNQIDDGGGLAALGGGFKKKSPVLKEDR